VLDNNKTVLLYVLLSVKEVAVVDVTVANSGANEGVDQTGALAPDEIKN